MIDNTCDFHYNKTIKGLFLLNFWFIFNKLY